MVPQNNYKLKHTSLTKSSSWGGAHWLLACGKYERPPYYSSKPKANEVWRFENSHCAGRAVSKTHSDKSVPPVHFPENLWENETLQHQPGDRQRGSTKNNIDTLTFDVCPFHASSSVSPWSPTTSYSRTSPGFSDSPCPYPQETIFRGTRRLIEMAKWVLAEPTTDTASAWDEVISPCRITLFSDILWNSKT